MLYKQIKVDFLLNKVIKKDRLFLGDYTIDPYQNCEFGCKYCDSSFDKIIYIKNNADKILEKELKLVKKGRIILGSVHDPYQKAEKNFKLTKKLLNIIYKKGFPVHILTKSDLIIRDIDLLKKMKNCIVTISIISVNNDISKIFEENVINPKKRLKIVKKLTDNNINTGVAIIPILPFIIENKLEECIKEIKEHNTKFLIHKYLELKGDQKVIFFKILNRHYPNFVKKYEELYKDSYMPSNTYINNINKTINEICKKYKLENKILEK